MAPDIEILASENQIINIEGCDAGLGESWGEMMGDVRVLAYLWMSCGHSEAYPGWEKMAVRWHDRIREGKGCGWYY